MQILLALQYVHSKRILHRDIKVHNVFLSQGRAMLGDFGVAKCLEESGDMAKSQVQTHALFGAQTPWKLKAGKGHRCIDGVYHLQLTCTRFNFRLERCRI